MAYWYNNGSQEIGPFGRRQLSGLLHQGAIAENASVREDGEADGLAIASVLANWADKMAPAQSSAWSLAITIASEVVKAAGWFHLPLDEPVVALHSGSRILLLVPCHRLPADQAEADLEAWFLKMQAKPWKGMMSQLEIVYCLPSPAPGLESIRKAKKVAFSGSPLVRLDYVDTQETPKLLGSLDKATCQAIAAGVRRYLSQAASGFEFLEQLVVSNHSHDEMQRRLLSVKPWGTYAILGVCLVMFGWATLAGGTEDTLTLLRFGANYWPLTVEQGQWWRLFGCTFMHIGFVHLACNLITLFSVGVRAEQIYGNQRFLALYALSGLGGSLASVFTGNKVSAGASGALFGVCGAVAMLGWRYRDQWPPAFRSSMFQGMLPMIGYNLLYGLSNSGIDNAAHLGGLVVGALFAFLVRPQALSEVEVFRTHATAMLAVGLIPFVMGGWMVAHAITRTSVTGYPTSSYTDSTGDLTVDMPALFKPVTIEGNFLFQGPGIGFNLQKLDDPNVVVISNPFFQQALKAAEGTTSVTTQVLAGRTWVLRDADAGPVKVRQAFTYFGVVPIRIEVAVSKGQVKEGEALRAMAMKSLRRKDFDPLSQGKALLKLGLHERALEEFSGLEETREVAVSKVESLTALARYDQAEALLARLEKEHPKDESVLQRRLVLLENQKKYEAALEACRKVIAAQTDPQQKFHKLVDQADLLEDLGRVSEAQVLYAQARAGYQNKAHIESDILNAQAWNLLQRGRYKEALPLAEQAVKAEANSSTLDTRGRALLEMGQVARAKADFEKVLNDDFNLPYANYAMGRILQEESDAEKARIFLYRYLALAGPEAEFAADAQERLSAMAK
jgi:membrane associated rhomboid family serine protease/tetratricopeptide (TPR) repeat protein